MDSPIRRVVSLLSLETEDVRMVAICGMVGIGKRTIAKTIRREIGRLFRYCPTLNDVGKTCCESPEEEGQLKLQRNLLSQIEADGRIQDTEEGVEMIQRKCREKKILLVMYDVSHGDQLKNLAGSRDWFHPGSRIIVTTTDRSIVQYREEMELYEVPLLRNADAYRFFTGIAFQDNDNTEAYEEIINAVVDFAQGLPLVLKVLGGLFRSTPRDEWGSTLQGWRSSRPREIVDLLKQSYESLEDLQKDAFLDIACFLKGQPERHVRDILKCCDLEPVAVMGVLQRKYLVTIENNKVDMHDWLQEMGRKIVREMSSNPCRRSRLWDPQEIREILIGEIGGTEEIQGMKMDLDAPEAVALSEEAFRTLISLRLFLAYKAQYSGNPIKLPRKLRCLEWEGYCSSSLPLNGSVDCELAGLYMRESKIAQIDGELQPFRNLKFLYLTKSASLRKIPDLSSLPMLEILDAEGCSGLVEVDQSLGELEKLVCLNFLDCQSLRTFPLILKSESLKEVTLKGCSVLSKFPDIYVRMDMMEQLFLDNTNIDELPGSIENLVGLKELSLHSCKRLDTLPPSIYRLQSLQEVHFDDCGKLNKFPEFADGSSSSRSTQNPLSFPNVAYIHLRGCILDDINFMSNLDCTSTLNSLDLSGNKLVVIPEFIRNFSALKVLRLKNCKDLRDIHGLPPNITDFNAEGCESLERCVPLSSFLNFDSDNPSHLLKFSGCSKLNQNTSSVSICPSIEDLISNSVIKILHPGSDFPKWFVREGQSEGGLVSFSVDSEEYKEIVGLALCMIIRSRKSISCDVQVSINNRRAYISGINEFESLGSEHIWLIYVPCRMMCGWDNNMNNQCNEFKVKFEDSWGHLKCCGVHLVLGT